MHVTSGAFQSDSKAAGVSIGHPPHIFTPVRRHRVTVDGCKVQRDVPIDIGDRGSLDRPGKGGNGVKVK